MRLNSMIKTNLEKENKPQHSEKSSKLVQVAGIKDYK
jgi:hypothetical protein